MEKFILKTKSFENGCGNVALTGKVALKISSKINASDDDIVKIQKSLTVRSDNLAKILNSKSSQPLFIDTNGPPSTSLNICDDENVQPQSNNEGTPQRILNGMDNLTSPLVMGQCSAINANSKTPQNHHMLARLKRDLDSPSAAVRLRAMKALKSPSNGPYNQFDVPHEEQDIITDEERQEVVPRTIQDVMKDVIVYVEVRSGDVNLTPSIKEIISEIGATVNDNFNKNTTHLVFSNGTQSTYNKAKRLNIPIVSVLWIRECKRQLRLVDPFKYSIHNAKQYENPELHKKAKVKKFLQTESELKIKKKKATATITKVKPIKIPKKAQDNLTGMINEFRERQIPNSDGINYFSDNFNVNDLLKDSESDIVNANQVKTTVAPTTLNETKINDNEKFNSTASSVISPVGQDSKTTTARKTPSNRKSMLALSKTPDSLVRVTRRTSMMTLSSPVVDKTTIYRNRFVEPEVITEITDANMNQTNNISEVMEITPTNAQVSPRIISNRKTIFTSSAMDITNALPSTTSTRKRVSIVPAKFKDFEVNTKKYLERNSTETNRRRTVFASITQKSSSKTVSTLTEVSDLTKSTPKRRRTLNAMKFQQELATIRNDASTTVECNNSVTRRALFEPNDTTLKPMTESITTKKKSSNSSSNLLAKSISKKVEKNSSSRRTVFTEGTSNPFDALPQSTPNDRRRTCFATIHTVRNQSPADDKSTNGLASIAQTTPIEHNKTISRDYQTPQNRTLFQEYSQRLSFSSTNKRQSVGDISLFILEQRLKNINELARLNRSVGETNVNTGMMGKRLIDEIERCSPQLPQPEKPSGNLEVLPPPPKKRKLFNPTEYEEEVAMKSIDSCDNNNESTIKLQVARKTKIPKFTAHKKRCNQRRSIIDFKTEPPKPVKVYASKMKPNSPMKYLAYSNLNQEQINILNEV
ncbi:Microcephalin [Pseudolycoriella hygida]|uniref:Microcephalin n=1 Tax=Pseudolycoriella hygida TaxID=35572 RepID=A0A9Q0N3Y1_9DIPT|nr:Microcephalin [Pseudolycoriella hygida]